MKMLQTPKLLAALLLFVLTVAVADGQQRWGGSGGRHYYGYQNRHMYYGPYWGKGRNYYTYYYYYRPNENADNYSYHTAFYYPNTVGNIRGGYYYYKNHHTGKFWGRCLPDSSDYELLPETKRQADLNAIAEGDFQRQGKMPPVPGMEPATPLIPPPMPAAPPAE